MLLNEAMKTLKAAGYECEPGTVTKNGITFDGIRITGREIAPMIYAETLEDMTPEKLIETVKKNIDEAPDITRLGSWETDKSRVYIHIRKKINDEAITEPIFGDLQLYVRIWIKENASVVVNAGLLHTYGISKEELFETAKENSRKDADIVSMASITGFDSPGMWIITNKNRTHGAGAVIYKDLLEDIAKKENKKLLVLIPSSVHEFLALAVDDLDNIKAITELINEVNNTAGCMRPVDILGTHPYIFNADTLEIKAA